MVASSRPPANAFVAAARKLYNPIGFAKGYNFVLWFIFAGALLGFSLARFMYLNVNGIFCNPDSKVGKALPGDCYHYSHGLGKAGILLHLAAILPAGVLVVFQFVPAIRHRAIIVHRVNGYVLLLLSVVSMAGVFMIARHSFAGQLTLQTATGFAAIVFLVGQALAYYNIKMLQIEQHRAWMIRSWVIAGFIITMRIIGAIMAKIIARGPSEYYLSQPCYVLDYIYRKNQTAALAAYPACSAFYSGADPGVQVPVRADMSGAGANIGSAYFLSFASGGWLALALHMVGAEIYLRLTPVEAERLRRVSYQRQLEAGKKRPGNMGLTAQRVGDAEPWMHPDQKNTAAAVKQGSVGGDSDAVEKPSNAHPSSAAYPAAALEPTPYPPADGDSRVLTR